MGIISQVESSWSIRINIDGDWLDVRLCFLVIFYIYYLLNSISGALCKISWNVLANELGNSRELVGYVCTKVSRYTDLTCPCGTFQL